MRLTDARRRIDEMPCRRVIAFTAAGTVNDRRHAGDRGVEADARKEITSRETDTFLVVALLASKHPDVVARTVQPTDNVTAERPRATGDQNGILWRLIHEGVLSMPYAARIAPQRAVTDQKCQRLQQPSRVDRTKTNEIVLNHRGHVG